MIKSDDAEHLKRINELIKILEGFINSERKYQYENNPSDNSG